MLTRPNHTKQAPWNFYNYLLWTCQSMNHSKTWPTPWDIKYQPKQSITLNINLAKIITIFISKQMTCSKAELILTSKYQSLCQTEPWTSNWLDMRVRGGVSLTACKVGSCDWAQGHWLSAFASMAKGEEIFKFGYKDACIVPLHPYLN